MINQPISFKSFGKVLKGQMTMLYKDDQKKPAILILPGSGSLNCDGNDAKGKFQLNVYKQLAHFLASLDFVVLRYDKRGIGESEGDYFSTGMWDLVNDAKNAVRFLKEHPQVDQEKIIVLGHSEGTTLAIALNALEEIHGLILLAGAGERMEEALYRQRQLAYEALKNVKGLKGKLIRMLKIEEKNEKKANNFFNKIMQSDQEVIKVFFQKINAKWFREHLQYDVLEDLQKVHCPVLAMTGDKDFQADPEKLQILPNFIKGDLEYYVIHNMDHLLKKHEGDFNVLHMKTIYRKKGDQPLHEELCSYLQKWLVNHFKTI